MGVIRIGFSSQKIPFSQPCRIDNEIASIHKALAGTDPSFSVQAQQLLSHILSAQDHVLLATSCTHALELALLTLNIRTGDEVILPSFTFPSTANAVVLRGGTPVFVDVRPDTMNIDETRIEEAITDRTCAIIPVHYAGTACAMDEILAIATSYNLAVVEDAAQGMGATYKDHPLGTLGDFGAISFHHTKNLQCGEGGALYCRSAIHLEQAGIIREKGTNKARFLRGEIDQYSWVRPGSSYVLAEINCALLHCQLGHLEAITTHRLALWQCYRDALQPLHEIEGIAFQQVPKDCQHNGHIFFLKARNADDALGLLNFLHTKGIQAASHYVPLHNTKPGKQLGRFSGKDRFTTADSSRLVRLPLYHSLTLAQVEFVAEQVLHYFSRTS